MKNTYLIFLTVAILILGGVGIYTLVSSASESSGKKMTNRESLPGEKMMAGDKNSNENTSDSKRMAGGQYVEYTPDILKKSNGRRILFFYADWCPTCSPADVNFRENVEKIPTDTTLIRVNYNDTQTDQSEKDLAKKYGITYQHTFVQIDQNGKEITKWNGGQIDELLSKIK